MYARSLLFKHHVVCLGDPHSADGAYQSSKTTRVGQAVNNVFGSRTYVVNSRVGIEVHSLTIRISKGTNRMDRSYRVGPKYTAVLQLRNHSANVVDDDDFKYRRTVRCGECCCTPLCSLSHVRNGAILRCAWRQLRRPPDSQL